MPVTWDRDDRAGWQVLDLTGSTPPRSTSARHWAEARLTGLGESHRVDTVLVVGELLDNAYRHAGGAVQLRLHQHLDPCEITVAVADLGNGTPRLRVPGHDGGRGLLLVDQACLTWGVSYHDDGKVVWARLGCADAELACPPAPSTTTGSN